MILQTPSNSIQKVKLWKNVLISLVGGSLLAGVFSIFHIPLNLLLLLLPVAIAIVVTRKFVLHNRNLFRTVGKKALISNLGGSLLLLLPMLPIVLPGVIISAAASHKLSEGVEKLNVFASPIITPEMEQTIKQQAEKAVKSRLPWFYRPAVWFGFLNDYAARVQRELENALAVARKAQAKPWYIRAVVDALKFLLTSLSLLASTWCILLFVQLFAGLFGRRLLSRYDLVRIALAYSGKGSGSMTQESTMHAGPSLSITLRDGETLFTKQAHLPSGAVPDVCFRPRDGALLARFLYNLFLLSRVTSREGHEIVFHASGGVQYISVRLDAEQEVAVDPHALVAYSDAIHFQRHWDFNIAIIGLHRIFYLIAQGPGLLVLRCNGAPVMTNRPEAMPVLPMAKLLLFDAHASFRPLASDGALNHVLSQCVVKPENGQVFIGGPAAANVNRVGILWRFIKHCYFPI